MEVEMKNKKFVKMFTRPFDIQRQEGALRQGAVFGLEEVVIIPSGEPGLFNWYFEEGQMKNVGRRVCEIFFDIKDFEDHVNSHERGIKRILELAEEFKKGSKDRKSMARIFKEFKRIINGRYSEVMLLPWGMDKLVEKLKEMVKEDLRGDVEKEWRIINEPATLIEIQEIQMKVSELFLKGELEESYNMLKEKYGWLTMNSFFDKPADEGYFRSLVLGSDVDEIKKSIEGLKAGVKRNKGNLDGVLDRIKNKKLREILENLNFYIAFRTKRIDNLRKFMFFFKEFYEHVLKYLGKEDKWCFDHVVYLTQEEIFDVLENNVLPDFKEIEKRLDLRNYHYYHYPGNYYLISDEKERGVIDAVLEKGLEDVDEVRGEVANPGCVQGVVKIIGKSSDIGKVEEGDVLVSPMTFPDFVPAMRKAVAIVTNEGGITCHAAIVSRELDKPCVIGTRFATDVFKDGDLVEVDADKGVVRRLERSGK